MTTRARWVDVDAAEVEPADALELFRRKAPAGAIPVAFDGILWLRHDDCDRYRAHYLPPTTDAPEGTP